MFLVQFTKTILSMLSFYVIKIIDKFKKKYDPTIDQKIYSKQININDRKIIEKKYARLFTTILTCLEFEYEINIYSLLKTNFFFYNDSTSNVYLILHYFIYYSILY